MRNFWEWIKAWWQALVGEPHYDAPAVPHEEMKCIRCGEVFCYDCGTAFSHLAECFRANFRASEEVGDGQT